MDDSIFTQDNLHTDITANFPDRLHGSVREPTGWVEVSV